MTIQMTLIQILVALGGFSCVAILINKNKVPDKIMDFNLYALVGIMFLVILGSVVIGTMFKLTILPILVTGMCSALMVHKTFDVF